MTTIAFIGSGHIGGTVARLSVAAGYDVVLSNSRGPETLKDLVAELGPRARAATPAEAAAAGDLVVVSIPLRAYRDVPVEPLAGKPVLDTNNYYPQRDGNLPSSTTGRSRRASCCSSICRRRRSSRSSTTSSSRTWAPCTARPAPPTAPPCRSRVTTPRRRRR
ncbi:NADPH-dependent F420 reductase [Nonomuraea rubra]|uniref:NADPH-dependent F420 reductase n=1 Tax=Nonomuraea rubra TaxID=46180 RepID=UPI00361830B1